MSITQRAYDKIGDLLQVEEERIKEELDDKPEWVAQEIVNELWDAYDVLYDAMNNQEED
jgi:hypothetical protein